MFQVFINTVDLRILVQGAEFQVVDARPPFDVPQAPHANIGFTTSLSFTWSFEAPCPSHASQPCLVSLAPLWHHRRADGRPRLSTTVMILAPNSLLPAEVFKMR